MTGVQTCALPICDGVHSNITNPTHSYNQYGSFNVKLKVTNESGTISTQNMSVNIGHYSLAEIFFSHTDTIGVTFPVETNFCYLDSSSNFIWKPVNTLSIYGAASYPYIIVLDDSSIFDNYFANKYLYFVERCLPVVSYDWQEGPINPNYPP